MIRSAVTALALLTAACNRERPAADRMEMTDTMLLERALRDAAARDSMLDTMPGGEMVRGDSAATMELLQRKK